MLDTNQFLFATALRWATKHPECATRIYKGLALAQSGKVAPLAANSFRVVGSRGTEYTVTVTSGYPGCSCPDHSQRKGRCKHVWSAALVTRLAQEIEETLCPPAPPALSQKNQA